MMMTAVKKPHMDQGYWVLPCSQFWGRGLFESVRCFVDWAEVEGGGLGGSTPLLLKLVLVTLNITSLLEKDQVDSGVTSMHIMNFL